MIVRQFSRCAHALLLAKSLLLGLSGTAAAQTQTNLHNRIEAALANNDAKAFSMLLAEDFVDQSEDFLGDGGLLRQLDEIHSAIPGAAVEVRIFKTDENLIAINRTIRGVAEKNFMGQEPPAIPITIEAIDFLIIEKGRVTSRRGLIDKIGALRQLTMPLPAPAPKKGVTVHEVMRFQTGEFPEGLIDNGAGGLFLTMLFDNKILSIAPDGNVSTFAELPITADPGSYQGTMCLAKDENGIVYLTVHSKTPEEHGLWRVDKDGSAELVAVMPQDSIPNGLSVDKKGRVYVADSSGAIWQWQPGASDAIKWMENGLVGRRPFIGNLPGPNGLKVHEKHVYLTISDTAAFVRIPIRRNGTAGEAELIAYGVPGDDFAIDSDGAAYVTTHPFNSVLKVTAKGVEEVLAGVEDGVVGPTSASFVETPDGPVLYVVTDGGLYAPIAGMDIIPRLMKINLD